MEFQDQRANQVLHLKPQDHLVGLDPREIAALQEQQDTQDQRENQVLQGTVPQELREILDYQALLVTLELRESAVLPMWEKMEFQEKMDCRDTQVQRENLVMEFKERRVILGLQDTLENLLLVSQERWDLEVIQELKETEVYPTMAQLEDQVRSQPTSLSECLLHLLKVWIKPINFANVYV